VVASAFANQSLYLVLANYGRSPVEIGTAEGYAPVDNPLASPQTLWNLPPRSLQILRRSA
jgi:hypothetical protein